MRPRMALTSPSCAPRPPLPYSVLDALEQQGIDPEIRTYNTGEGPR